MAKAVSTDRILETEAVGKLLRIVEEATRSTREGARRFVEPADGTLERAKTRRHHIIFGRRGSGKSSLLTKAASELNVDRRPIVLVDLEEFKGHTYPDVLISVLIRILTSFNEWLDSSAVNSANKTTFWQKLFGSRPTRPALNRREVAKLQEQLLSIKGELDSLLFEPEEAELQERSQLTSQSTVNTAIEGGASGAGARISAKLQADSGSSEKHEFETKYRHKKIATLQRNVLKYKNFFSELSKVSGGPAFLLLDDLYHIPRKDQSHLIDYFHKIAKGCDLWLKVGTIRHRTRWYVAGDPPIGMKLGDDADEIDLDVTLEKYDITKRFLLRILENLCDSAEIRLSDILADGARDRLVLASGGVARDFLTIFRRSIDVARERVQGKSASNRGPKIGAEDVNVAAGEYDKFKREDFERDTGTDEREKLIAELSRITDFCVQSAQSNCVMVEKDKKSSGIETLHELVDLKFLHQIRSRVTVRDAPGTLYEAYMLDLSQYTGERKRRNLEMIEFWGSDGVDKLRRKKLVLEI